MSHKVTINAPPYVVRSNYKMKCCACNDFIKRGEEITRTCEAYGMNLRARHYKEGGGELYYTGARWVHKMCQPTSVKNGKTYNIWTMYSSHKYAEYLNNTD